MPIQEEKYVVDTYCISPDCKGQDGDGWGDCDVEDAPNFDWPDTVRYTCHTCKTSWYLANQCFRFTEGDIAAQWRKPTNPGIEQKPHEAIFKAMVTKMLSRW